MDRMSLGVGIHGELARNVAQVRLSNLPVTIGRHPCNAVRVEHAWMPRRLATVDPSTGSVMLRNGLRTRSVVRGPGLEATVQPGACLHLSPGKWKVRWPELDHEVVTLLWLDDDEDGYDWPSAGDRADADGHPRAFQGTEMAGQDVGAVLNDLQRRRLAVLFRHVVEGRPAPDRFYQQAAEQLGASEQVLKNLVRETRDRLNDQRGLRFGAGPDQLEVLGYYLVHTTGVLRREHLDTALR